MIAGATVFLMYYFNYREVDNPGKEIEMRVLRYIILAMAFVIVGVGVIGTCGFTGALVVTEYYLASDVIAIIGFVIGAFVGLVLAILAIWYIWRMAKRGDSSDF